MTCSLAADDSAPSAESAASSSRVMRREAMPMSAVPLPRSPNADDAVCAKTSMDSSGGADASSRASSRSSPSAVWRMTTVRAPVRFFRKAWASDGTRSAPSVLAPWMRRSGGFGGTGAGAELVEDAGLETVAAAGFLAEPRSATTAVRATSAAATRPPVTRSDWRGLAAAGAGASAGGAVLAVTADGRVAPGAGTTLEAAGMVASTALPGAVPGEAAAGARSGSAVGACAGSAGGGRKLSSSGRCADATRATGAAAASVGPRARSSASSASLAVAKRADGVRRVQRENHASNPSKSRSSTPSWRARSDAGTPSSSSISCIASAVEARLEGSQYDCPVAR